MNVLEVIFSLSSCGCSNATHSLGLWHWHGFISFNSLEFNSEPLRIIGCDLVALSLVGTLR